MCGEHCSIHTFTVDPEKRTKLCPPPLPGKSHLPKAYGVRGCPTSSPTETKLFRVLGRALLQPRVTKLFRVLGRARVQPTETKLFRVLGRALLQPTETKLVRVLGLPLLYYRLRRRRLHSPGLLLRALLQPDRKPPFQNPLRPLHVGFLLGRALLKPKRKPSPPSSSNFHSYNTTMVGWVGAPTTTSRPSAVALSPTPGRAPGLPRGRGRHGGATHA